MRLRYKRRGQLFPRDMTMTRLTAFLSCGRLGAVIILSPVARLAWEARGELVRKDREGRVMIGDLVLEGQRALRLGSAYFPTTGASLDERQAFYDEITRCSAGGEPHANTTDVEPQKGGFYSDPYDTR